MKINVTGGELAAKELNVYVELGQKQFGAQLVGIDIKVINDEEVEVKYTLATNTPFERIRRITGYLTGTLNRWNNAKRAEERDRVKHIGGEADGGK